MTAPIPDDEVARLLALHGCNILDTPPEREFDTLTSLAAQILNTPIALVSLIDTDRQWFKSRHGIDACETPRAHAFCAHVILRDEAMIVRDTIEDPRFRTNPLVAGAPHIRFYAGAPIRLETGERLGSFCVVDRKPRPDFSARDEEILFGLARLTAHLIEARSGNARALREVTDRLHLIADLELTRTELVERLASKRTFLRKLNHDLRTPLNSILCCSTMLRNAIHGPHTHPRYRDYAGVIETAAHAMTEPVNAVSDYMKTLTGDMKLARAEYQLNDILAEVIDVMAPAARSAGLSFTAQLDPEDAVVWADRIRLKQIFFNLLSNAVKFTPSGGAVHIQSQLAGDMVAVSIQDSGLGMTDHDRLKAFSPFARLPQGSRQPAGAGLGLPIAELLTEQHKGTLTLLSAPGHGTNVVVSLPLMRLEPHGETEDDDKEVIAARRIA